MSKNFELLQRAERMDSIVPLSITAAPSKSPDRLTAAKPIRRNPDPKSDAMAKEEALKLVHRIFYSQGASEIRAVVFAGVGSGDACARVCSATGEVLAAQGTGSVCVVDADLRSPSIHEFFRTDNLSGLSDALVNSENIRSLAVQTSQSNLWVVPGGGRALSLPALFNSEQMIRRIAELRREFDYVLVSAPPADLFAEAATLGRVADGAVLVVQAERSLREATRKAKQVLEAADVRLLGAVLNDRTFPIPQALYNRLG